MDNIDLEAKLIAYSTEFLNSYTEAVRAHYAAVLEVVHELEFEEIYFPLYECEVGKNISVAALFTSSDFFLFFLEDGSRSVTSLVNADSEIEFSRNWTFSAPYDARVAQVIARLGIKQYMVRPLIPGTECVNIPGTNFMHGTIESIVRDAQSHGNDFGNQAGQAGKKRLPKLRRTAERLSKLEGFGGRYAALRDSSMRPQSRGQKFEELWRDVLYFYGWHPKKIRISGEENDFTAIYQGLHILGEVRWFEGPMTGGKMREFLGKLDPRPQTIGMFISHSGLDEGAWSVLRRAVNSKTVIVFELEDIEEVLLRHTDIGPVFNRKLRDAYDYLFESGYEF